MLNSKAKESRGDKMREDDMQNITLSIVSPVCVVLALACLLTLGEVHADEPKGDLQVVSHVDLSRYLGKWYEIAHIPVFFQKGKQAR